MHYSHIVFFTMCLISLVTFQLLLIMSINLKLTFIDQLHAIPTRENICQKVQFCGLKHHKTSL